MMSRNHTRSTRGRQSVLLGPKISKSRDTPDALYQEPRRGRKLTRTYAASVQNAKKRRRESSTTVESSSNGEDAAEEAEDEDSEDDVEEPAVKAPLHDLIDSEVGRKYQLPEFDNISVAGSTGSMFGDLDYHNEDDDPNVSPEENMRNFEQKVFGDSEDEDDAAYRAVDEISDSEDDNADAYEEQQLLANLSDDGVGDYLNQIDGMSAYGFGNESDGTAQFPPSSPGSDNGAEGVHSRHVHFDINHASNFRSTLSESPTISRALLPSALPLQDGVFAVPASASSRHTKDAVSEGTYDSDATDDDLPAEAFQTAATAESDGGELPTPKPSPPPAAKPVKKIGLRKGPPRGIFIDTGDKPSGILDPTGTKILMMRPDLLGEAFARRYNASATSTPEMGLAEMLEESEGASQISADAVPTGMDAMISGSNSFDDHISTAQTLAAQGAFDPAPNFMAGDYDIEGQDLENQLSGDPDCQDLMEDMIKFEDDSDSDGATSPVFMPSTFSALSTRSSGLEHLNSSNISAFRQHADSRKQHLRNTPSFNKHSDFSTPSRPRKRKAESPYSSNHYKGVTPVQRMRDPDCPTTPNNDGRSKRRRMMTL